MNRGTRIVNLSSKKKKHRTGTPLSELKQPEVDDTLPQYGPPSEDLGSDSSDGVKIEDVTDQEPDAKPDVKKSRVPDNIMVTDAERKIFMLRLQKTAQALKQQSLEQFCELTKHLLQDLYTAFKKRRVAIQTCMNEVSAAIALNQAGTLIAEFDEDITPREHYIESRDDRLFMECKDMKFMKALDIENTWPTVPDKIKRKIWTYIEQLNSRKQMYLKPEPTEQEIDQILERSARKVSTFIGQHGRLPDNPQDIVRMGQEVTNEQLGNSENKTQ